MKITIKKSKHLSNQLTTPRFGLFNNGQVVCTVKFTKDSIYDLGGEDQLDWNKLSAGASWGFFPLVKQWQAHENSSRWGWRYNKDKQCIQITPYFYSDGVRNYAETLGIKPIDLWLYLEYKLTIKPYSSYVRYSVEDIDGKVLFEQTFQQNIPSINGWLLPAFFGGNKPAPIEIEYELNYL